MGRRSSKRSGRAIDFQTMPCERCKTARVIGQPCDACGEAPRLGEVNARVVARRQRLRAFRAAIEAELHSEGRASSFDEAWLRTFPSKMSQALSSLIDPNSGDIGIAQASTTVATLYDARNFLEAQAELRPTGFARAHLEVVAALEESWNCYERACSADSIREAQSLAQRGQALLDSAPSALTRLSEKLRAFELFADDHAERSVVRRAFTALEQLHDLHDYEEFVALGRSLVSIQIGVAAADGPAVDYLLLDLISHLILDPAQMSLKLQELSQSKPSRQRLQEIADMREALPDLVVARRDLYEVLDQFAILSGANLNETSLVRRLVKTVGELYEASLPMFVWLRLLSNQQQGEDRYLRLRLDDATTSVDKLRKLLPNVTSDLARHLRNASHHGRAVDIDDKTFDLRFSLRSFSGAISLSRYFDEALALLESVLAINWSLECWLEEVSTDLEYPEEFLASVGVAADDFAWLWLRSVCDESSVASELGVRDWALTADLTESQAFTSALVLAGAAPRGIEEVRLAGDPTSSEWLTLRLSDADEHRQAILDEDMTKVVLATIDLRSRCSLDGECILTIDDLRFLVWLSGSRLVDGDLKQIGILRRVRIHALALRDESLADFVSALLRSPRKADVSEERAQLRAVESWRTHPPEIPAASNVRVLLT